MQKGRLVYEGKAKRVYEVAREDAYLVEFKDDATALNGEKRGSITDKGVVNNQVSAQLFQMLEAEGVRTHYLEMLAEREMLVRRVQIIPLEVVTRNVVAGSLSKRVGLPEGHVLSRPVVEFYYKNDSLGDPLINRSHAVALGLSTKEDMDTLEAAALRVNALLGQYLLERGLQLIDFKLEYGRLPDQTIILADEISPDTCRLWDIKTQEKMDKDRFRRDLGNVEEAYQEVLLRLTKGGRTTQ